LTATAKSTCWRKSSGSKISHRERREQDFSFAWFAVKAAEGRRTPRRFALAGDLRILRQLLECASPLALFVEANGARFNLEWTTRSAESNVKSMKENLQFTRFIRSQRHLTLIVTSLCVFVALLGLVIQIGYWCSAPRVYLAFNGRPPSYWRKFEDGSLAANFTLSNLTSQRLYSSNVRAQIQVKTTAGWTNIPNAIDSEPEPDDRIEKSYDRETIMPHTGWRIDRHVPQKKLPWRLQVTYTVPAPEWSRFFLIYRIAPSLGVRDREYEIFSDEFPPEPVR
jgi:hypothetical protein